MMGVSVVVTTYNDSEFLSRALASIAAQTTPPLEVIVVDDGSDINSAESIVSQAPVSRFPIRFIRKENGGPSSARNTGLRAATQEFIAFLDADDVWVSTNIEQKLRLLSARSERYFGAYGSFRRDDSRPATKFASFDGAPSADLIGRQGGVPGGAPAYLFRRATLLSIGGFDEALSINEDFDLLLRLFRQGYQVVGDPTPGFIRTMRAGSLTRNDRPAVTYERIARFLEKAARGNYFSAAELDRRWRHARLAMARNMVRSGAGWRAASSAVRKSFDKKPPTNLIERLVLFAARFVPADPSQREAQ